ncbi:hypothetical protein COOONC_01568 [Cooperia oncophora]
MQCVGSCCDSFERCHPHSVRILERPVVEMVYVGNGRFMLNQTLNISMEEHTSCSCYDCGPNVPECPPGSVIGSDCTCQCANKSDRHNCQGGSIQLTPPPTTHQTPQLVKAPTLLTKIKHGIQKIKQRCQARGCGHR